VGDTLGGDGLTGVALCAALADKHQQDQEQPGRGHGRHPTLRGRDDGISTGKGGGVERRAAGGRRCTATVVTPAPLWRP
jgi:hypothetical protein